MHGLPRFTCCGFFLLITIAPLHAASVFRCEDQNGHVTFTLQGCPADHLLEVQRASNPTPSSGKPVAMASIRPRKTNSEPSAELTIVAEKQDGCGNQVTGTKRRTAIIRQQIQGGMTQEDVESSLGKPDAQTTHNGETRYSYTDNDGTSRQISFDQNGCVKNKR